MKYKKTLNAINIQWPISRDILSGAKTIETRTYPIPKKYIDKDLYIIETPGKSGKFKSRAIGIIRFNKSIEYSSKTAFYRDTKKHLVDKDSTWCWKDKPKWGWCIISVTPFNEPVEITQKKGIRYTNDVTLSFKLPD